MPQFFTADLHFGHQNIISYCQRPYSSVQEMNRDLVARWNSRVGVEDTVYILGDLALGRLPHDLGAVLNGTKIFIRGNHDTLSNQAYKSVGFQHVYPDDMSLSRKSHIASVRFQVRDDAVLWERPYFAATPKPVADNWESAHPEAEVVAMHYPFRPPDPSAVPELEQRYLDRHVPGTVTSVALLLHGHIHTSWLKRGAQINVGVDAWAGFPVSVEQISQLAHTGGDFVECPAWE